METNRVKLDTIMRDHDLTASQVAKLVGASSVMVRQWRCGLYRMPDHRLQLLELKLVNRQQGPAA